jgi:TetR/AcrR family transcriptional regulator, regulator of autoinduction and epiphytic fitness
VARHRRTELRTPFAAGPAPAAAASLRKKVLFDPMSRTSLSTTSTRALALAGSADPSPAASDHLSFVDLVRDIMVLGQQQGAIRKDEDAAIMTLFLLGAYVQTMRHMLTTGSFEVAKLKYLLRLVLEGVCPRPGLQDAQPGN